MSTSIPSRFARKRRTRRSASGPRERRLAIHDMNYALERQGDEWHIKSRNMQTHGTAAARADRFAAGPSRRAGRRKRRARCLPDIHRSIPAHQNNEGCDSRRRTFGCICGRATRFGRASNTVVFDEKLAWEKPCGGGLTWKAYSQYPFLAENATPKKIIARRFLPRPKASRSRFRSIGLC